MKLFKLFALFMLFTLLGLSACAGDPVETHKRRGPRPPPLEPPICPTGMTLTPIECTYISKTGTSRREGWIHFAWDNNSDNEDGIYLRAGVGMYSQPWDCNSLQITLSPGTTSYDYWVSMNGFPCQQVIAYVYSSNEAGDCTGSSPSGLLNWVDFDDFCKHNPP